MYLLVITTWSCNLACTYCGVRKKNYFISREYLKKSIDLLLTSRDEELKLEFFGGEPLLLPFPVIKEAILYGRRKAKASKRDIQFIMTTNGILLDKEKISFFKRHNVRLILSLDGLRKSQNINRPQAGKKDSYSLIVKNLPLIFKEKVDCYCYTVVTPQTVSYFYKNLTGLVALGFTNIWMMMACGVAWKTPKIKQLQAQLKKIAKAYPDMLLTKGVALLNLENWLSPFRMNTELSVNIDGYLYSACLSYLITDEKVRKKYVIGHIDTIEGSIDSLEAKRLSNEKAMEVVYRENNITRNLPSNIKVGRIFAGFSIELKEELLRRNIWHIYKQCLRDSHEYR